MKKFIKYSETSLNWKHAVKEKKKKKIPYLGKCLTYGDPYKIFSLMTSAYAFFLNINYIQLLSNKK